MISRFQLAVILMISLAAKCSGDIVEVRDEIYKDGCGPIACVVALRSLGYEASLEKLCSECGWKQGEPVRLKEMKSALDSHAGVECIPAHLTPTQLAELLDSDCTVVILALSKHSKAVNHAVCAVEFNEDGQVKLVDYPELIQFRTLGEIASVWDGHALVVRVGPGGRTWRKFSVFVVPCLSILLVFAALKLRHDCQSAT